MQARDISKALADQVAAVCLELLPGGKREGKHWVCGSVDGEPGKSLKVNLTGSNAGKFCDFASEDDRGDLLDLWQLTRRVDFVTACTEAKNFLGIHDQDLYRDKKTYKKPENFKGTSKESHELDYLRGRGLTDKTLKDFRITGGSGRVYFPFFKGSELVACKWRSITEKETRATSEGQKPILFGWQAVGSVREITICEGEIDAMSLHQMGIQALSVPFGANNLDWIENEWESLGCFESIFICMDSDEAGKDAAKKIINRLGAHRCRYVNLPAKDANECLQLGLIPQLKIAFDRSVTLDPVQLKNPKSYQDEVIKEIYPELNPEGEVFIPIVCDRYQEFLRFREDELIVVNGINGHGKSQWTLQQIVEATRHGFKSVLASMEMKPKRSLKRMVLQTCGIEKPSEEYIGKVLDWLGDSVYIFDVLGTAKVDEMLSVFEYAVKRYGVHLFVIDSLMKCGVEDDDYNGQKKFIEKLCEFKNRFGVTIILVTHSKKGESEDKPTGKWDVKGSGSITDLVDTVLTVWRNKPKEKEMSSDDQSLVEDAKKKPDCLVICSKQRNGNWEGTINYWFDPATCQYTKSPDARPYNYMGIRS